MILLGSIIFNLILHFCGAVVDGYGGRREWTNRTVWKLFNWIRRDWVIVSTYACNVLNIAKLFETQTILMQLCGVAIFYFGLAILHRIVFQVGYYDTGNWLRRNYPPSEWIMPKEYEIGFRVVVPAMLGFAAVVIYELIKG